MRDQHPVQEQATEAAAEEAGGAWWDDLPLALVVADGNGRIVQWGMAAEEMFGYPPEAVVGLDGLDLLLPVGDHAQARAFQRAVTSGRSVTGSFRVRHQDGSLIEVDLMACPVSDPSGQGGGVLVLSAYASAARRAREAQALVDELFARSPVGLAVFDTALRFQRVNPALEAMNGVPKAAHIGRRLAEVLPGLNTEHMEAAMRRTLQFGTPMLIRRIGRTPANTDRDRVWSCSYFRLEDPNGQPVGISASIIDITAHQGATWDGDVGDRRHRQLLNDATLLVGTTLDIQQTAQELADIVVPRLADAVTVDVLQTVSEGADPGAGLAGGVALRRMGLAPSVGTPITDILTPVGRTLAFPANAPYVQALADRRPFLLAHLDARAIAPATPYSDKPARLLGQGMHSFMMAPLIARDVVLGVATFYRAGRSDPYDSADVALACDLTAHASVCIDNARLYSREHDTAVLLQRSLLPQRIQPPEGIEVAHCYQPASDVNEVGGDWYDVIPLGPGKAALVIGDVMGHGIRAAAAMGEMRTTARALARLGLPPDQLLSHLDQAMQELNDPLMATCLYGVCDAGLGRCQLARAGHPPPVTISPNGSARLLDLPVGAPLGIGGITYTSSDIPLAPGSLLVLYTDGLIEKRGTDLDERLTYLTHFLTGAPRPLTDYCDRLIAQLAPHPAEDDIALLIARIGPLPS
ncbi:SpoIIE family protein phosphatase [Streptomyces maoxianensis]|uniref:SpoIIE family protein phosphatase n=1 Tax=Streptomyces maoxianensis TaxID=1459942 RepID=A0ABV9GF37_9ACTN